MKNKKDYDEWWDKPFTKEEYQEYFRMKNKVNKTDKQIYDDFWFDCDVRLEKRKEEYEEILNNTDFFDE